MAHSAQPTFGNHVFRQIISDITGFGSPFFYILAVFSLSLWNPEAALRIILSIFTAEIVCGIIKLVFPRPRPKPRPFRGVLGTYDASSFPSIHTTRITALGLGFVFATQLISVILVAIPLITLVGYSRVYLGHHHVSDIVGGLIIGAILSVLFFML